MPHKGFEGTPPERSAVMRAIRSKGTKPEMLVRQALHRAGLRFRLHRKGMPGKPDIVLPSRGLVINVHGCFWHQHEGCSISKVPKSRQSYWVPKLARNVERDQRNADALRSAGWAVMTIWECDAGAPRRLAAFIEGVRSLPVRRPRKQGELSP